MRVELRHLRYFEAVAEEGSFTRAATRLRVAQPALSQQVRDLERELGVVLLDRAQRPVRTTRAGALLLTHCHELFAGLETVRRAMNRAGRGETGLLLVGYPTGGLHPLLVQVLADLRATAPDIEVELHPLAGPEQLRALRARRVDVAVVRLTEPVDGTGLLVRPLRDEHLLVMVASTSPLAAGSRVELSTLAGRRLVAFPRRTEPLLAARYDAACARAGMLPAEMIEVPDAQTQAMHVGADLGVALTGDGLAVRFPGVAYLPAEPATVLTRIAVAVRDEQPDPLVERFLGLLRNEPGRWSG